MSESRRPPPPTIVDRQPPAAKHTNPNGYRLSNAHKAALQEPIPGYQDFFAKRFELARWLIDRHTRLTSERANSGLRLALIDLLAAALSFWVFARSTSSGIAFYLLFLLLLLLIVIWGCLLLAITLALSASFWRRSNSTGDVETDIYFESGDTPPETGGISQNQSLFSQRFLQTNQYALLNSAMNAVYAYEKRRQVQEQRIRIAIFSTIIAFLGLGLAAIAALLGML